MRRLWTSFNNGKNRTVPAVSFLKSFVFFIYKQKKGRLAYSGFEQAPAVFLF
ncbi:hypothetical protein B4119_0732 [Parageobacillus caldoxylosilyticus]|jgi:hypothetical protein|uniref:Uncharacterized protein n=1 Tax=Saccharococcus caldoxylosilyticus TaxID=81408 RepID=A0A150M0F5_9BACL|nr:hypothetical protein B4119_0732 [Parageobacillus caldoxylosilyticus]